jgi:hypothetical protein
MHKFTQLTVTQRSTKDFHKLSPQKKNWTLSNLNAQVMSRINRKNIGQDLRTIYYGGACLYKDRKI